MGSRLETRFWLAATLCCAAACAGSYARAVDETRAGLLGLDGRELRACLGVPSDFVIDGDVEQQSYRLEPGDDPDVGFGPDGIGGYVNAGRYPGERAASPERFPLDQPDRSYCQLDFELTQGRVTRVSAEGRTREGMNTDTTCLLRARMCLPYDSVEEIERSE